MNVPGAAALTRCVGEAVPLPPLPLPGRDAMAGRAAVVLGGDGPMRAAVCAEVRRHGGRALDVPDDADAAREALAAGVDRAGVIIDLNVCHIAEVAPSVWWPALARSYEVLGAVAPDWAAVLRTGRVAYLAVTALGGLMGADGMAISQPASGLWAGLARTLPRELPACTVRVVDHDMRDAGELAAAVVGELATGRFQEVGWSGGTRHALLPVGRPLPAHRGVAGAPADLGPGCVVMTGGGRGIGFHLARRLAQGGRPVVVTGRADLGEFDPAELNCDDQQFRALRARRLSGVRGGDALRAARGELGRLARARELVGNLRAAREVGADLDYRRCDVTDAGSLRALLAGVGGPVAALVHDAGIDLPARIGRKDVGSVRSVVGVKLDGFLNLLSAADAEGVSQARICAVGSLTGRFGGTAGQSDYAGANEALARCVDWAAARRAQPVACLSWPTWESVGLITNPAAAVREMSAVPVDVGVEAWEGELRAGTRGEVLLLGRPAPLSPVQVASLPVPSTWSGARTVLQRRHALGQVRSWRPGDELETVHTFRPATLPAAAGFLVRGRPSLPVSLVVDLLLDAAGWLLAHPTLSVRELSIDVSLLVLPPDAGLTLRRTARRALAPPGAPHGADGAVEVLLCADDRVVASSVVPAPAIRSAEGSTIGSDPEGAGGDGADRRPAGPAELPPAVGPFAWPVSAGVLTRRRVGTGWLLHAEARRGDDVHAGHAAPQPTVPLGMLEAMAWAACPQDPLLCQVQIEELRVGAGDATARTVGILREDGSAFARDAHGRTVLEVRGLRWTRSAPEALAGPRTQQPFADPAALHVSARGAGSSAGQEQVAAVREVG